MGEYEPDDSRKVTQTDNRAPGEPPRTGPREDEARRRAQRKEAAPERPRPGKAERLDEQQQRSPQAQAQGGESRTARRAQAQSQSQSQSRSGSRGGVAASAGNPDTQRMQSEPGGALAGNQPQAIDNGAGVPKPHYDQYEVNQPTNMHQQPRPEDATLRQQAGMQDGGRASAFGFGADSEEDDPETGEDGQNGWEGEADAADPAAKPAARGYGGRSKAAQENS